MEKLKEVNITAEPVDVSIIIPAFNEACRLPLFLERCIRYCSCSAKIYEIIVVDDGSTDKTLEIIMAYKSKFSHLYVISNQENRGKGHAIKRGFLNANGRVCVFLDADGSTDPDEIDKNIHYIFEDEYDIFVGSRVLVGSEQVLKIKWYRRVIGMVFNFFVHTFLFKDIRDPQCGFKMFRKEIVKPLFLRTHLCGFGIDIEILYLAHKMGYKVKEGYVSWQHMPGSKVNFVIDSLTMFLNIFQIRKSHYVAH